MKNALIQLELELELELEGLYYIITGAITGLATHNKYTLRYKVFISALRFTFQF